MTFAKPARDPGRVHLLWLEAYNAGDLDGAMSFYETGACFVSKSGQVSAGAEGVRDAYRRILVNRPQIQVRVEKVISAGEDLALVIVPWSVSTPSADGKVQTLSGVATDVVRRQPDGRWLLVIDNPYGID